MLVRPMYQEIFLDFYGSYYMKEQVRQLRMFFVKSKTLRHKLTDSFTRKDSMQQLPSLGTHLALTTDLQN